MAEKSFAGITTIECSEKVGSKQNWRCRLTDQSGTRHKVQVNQMHMNNPADTMYFARGSDEKTAVGYHGANCQIEHDDRTKRLTCQE